MTTPTPNDVKFSVKHTMFDNNAQKASEYDFPVPDDQKWLYLQQQSQINLLDKINGKLTFFTVLTIIGLAIFVISILARCG